MFIALRQRFLLYSENVGLVSLVLVLVFKLVFIHLLFVFAFNIRTQHTKWMGKVFFTKRVKKSIV